MRFIMVRGQLNVPVHVSIASDSGLMEPSSDLAKTDLSDPCFARDKYVPEESPADIPYHPRSV